MGWHTGFVPEVSVPILSGLELRDPALYFQTSSLETIAENRLDVPRG